MNDLAPSDPVTETCLESDDPYFVGSFGKGLLVIKVLAEAAQGMSLAEVAEETGTTRASARRYLMTLISLGYAEQIGKRFELTPRILELGGPRYDSGLTWMIAQPLIEEIARKLNESCSAMIRDHEQVVCTAHVDANRLLACRIPVGTRLPGISSAAGRVILSDISDDCIQEVIEKEPPRRRTPFTLTEPRMILDAIRKARSDGFSVVDQEIELGLRSIAVPIRNARGRVFAGLTISAESARVEVRTMIEDYFPVLAETAARISKLAREA